MLKKIILLVTFITFLFSAISPSFAQEQSPQEFVKSMYDQTIDIYKINKDSPDKGLQISLKFISDNFAMVTSTRFVLGRSVRKLNKDQYAVFKEDLTAMLSYAIREKIGAMPSKEFLVSGVVTRGHSLFVSSKLLLKDGGVLHADWRIRKSSKTNTYLLQDIIIEGVSIIKSYKDSTSEKLKKVNYNIENFLEETHKEVKILESGQIPKSVKFIH